MKAVPMPALWRLSSRTPRAVVGGSWPCPDPAPLGPREQADQTWRVRARRRRPNRLIQLPAFRHGEAHSRHRPDRDTKVSGSIRTMRGGRVNAPLLTARAVADLLGVSTETVLRWSRCGSLPSLCLPGGAIRFRQDELDAWLEERRRPRRAIVTHTTSRTHAPRPAR